MHFPFDIFKCYYAWEVLIAHPLVVTQTSQLHPDFIRAIVGVNALYFYLAVKPLGFIWIKGTVQRKGLLWRPMVLQRDLWTRDYSQGEGWSRKGNLVWCAESNRNPRKMQTLRWSCLAREQWCLTRFLQEAFWKVRFVCVSQTNNRKILLPSPAVEEKVQCQPQCRRLEGIWNSGANVTVASTHYAAGQLSKFKVNAMQSMRLANTSTSALVTLWECACTNSYHPRQRWWSTNHGMVLGLQNAELTYVIRQTPPKMGGEEK